LLRGSMIRTRPPLEACISARFPSGAASLTLTTANRITSALHRRFSSPVKQRCWRKARANLHVGKLMRSDAGVGLCGEGAGHSRFGVAHRGQVLLFGLSAVTRVASGIWLEGGGCDAWSDAPCRGDGGSRVGGAGSGGGSGQRRWGAAGGSWGMAREVPGTAALNAGGQALILSVSCVSAGNCSAGGFYTNKSRHEPGGCASMVRGGGVGSPSGFASSAATAGTAWSWPTNP
jgi:hypothetical protein